MNNLIFYFFNNLLYQYQSFDTFIWFLAEPFIFIVMGGILVFFIIKYQLLKTKKLASTFWSDIKRISRIFIAGGFAWLSTEILKSIIKSDRPFVKFTDIQPLFHESSYAFPSGHSATIAALAFSVFFINKRAGYVCLIAMLLIGVSRVVAGVHFPIDILGGYALGFTVAYLLKSR